MVPPPESLPDVKEKASRSGPGPSPLKPVAMRTNSLTPTPVTVVLKHARLRHRSALDVTLVAELLALVDGEGLDAR
jgi:hypothetical protein